jgi:hypothetical protein
MRTLADKALRAVGEQVSATEWQTPLFNATRCDLNHAGYVVHATPDRSGRITDTALEA